MSAVAARLAPDREAIVAAPGGHVYVRVNGDPAGGRAPLVLIHGGPGGAHWSLLNATALADERAVILYDQLDSGRSDRPGDPANWVMPRFLAELDGIRAHLGIARWHVLGASWGGTIALEYGATRPAALAGLVLQSPLVSTRLWLEDAARLKAAMPAVTRALLDAADAPDGAATPEERAAIAEFYRRHVRRREPPSAIAAYRDALPSIFNDAVYRHLWGRAEFSCTGALAGYDGTPLLARLDGPRTLFVAGEDDEATPATVAALAARVPGARFTEVADCAHMILNDNPRGFLDVLRPWLRAMDAR